MEERFDKGIFMRKERFERLLKENVISENDLKKSRIDFNENGDINLCSCDTYTDIKYGLGFDYNDVNLCEFVKRNIVPPLGIENYIDVFRKYGYTYCGICDGFRWITTENINETMRENGYIPIEEAPEEDLWKIIGICSLYWENVYEELYYSKK